MQTVNPDTRLSKAHLYRDLAGQLAALFAGERNGLANAAVDLLLQNSELSRLVD